jgi:SAM-dependent methyltransferase
MTRGSLRLLHVGCGRKSLIDLPPPFNQPPWEELRLDIDARQQPDIVASITDMRGVESASFDGVWSSHNIEHLYPHDVPLALAEFARVLTPTGFAVVTVPDLQAIAELVGQGRLFEPLYAVPAGPVAAIDMLYGFRPELAAGNHYMAHRTGFTDDSLEHALLAAGFTSVSVRRDGYWALWAVAALSREDAASTSLLADNLVRNG